MGRNRFSSGLYHEVDFSVMTFELSEDFPIFLNWEGDIPFCIVTNLVLYQWIYLAPRVTEMRYNGPLMRYYQARPVHNSALSTLQQGYFCGAHTKKLSCPPHSL